MNRDCSLASFVQAAEPSPNDVAFAIEMASSMLSRSKEHSHWTKDLFARNRRRQVDIIQHGWFVKVSRSIRSMTASQDSSTAINRFLELARPGH